MDQFVLDFESTKKRLEEIDLSENDEKTLAAIGPYTVLEVARRFVEENAGDGVNCPCCGRLVKEYRRKPCIFENVSNDCLENFERSVSFVLLNSHSSIFYRAFQKQGPKHL